MAGLTDFLEKVPAVEVLSEGHYPDGRWWVKLAIDTSHPLAWQVVQEFGHVLNYIAINERLPTIFYPVSPPPYMNGGPSDFLSWIIESAPGPDAIPHVITPEQAAEWLEGRLPRPVDDIGKWQLNDP